MNFEEIIARALEVSHTIVYPIKDFTMEDLVKLAKLAKKNKIEIRIKNKTNNFYQGVLLETQRFHNRADCRRPDEK